MAKYNWKYKWGPAKGASKEEREQWYAMNNEIGDVMGDLELSCRFAADEWAKLPGMMEKDVCGPPQRQFAASKESSWRLSTLSEHVYTLLLHCDPALRQAFLELIQKQANVMWDHATDISGWNAEGQAKQKTKRKEDIKEFKRRGREVMEVWREYVKSTYARVSPDPTKTVGDISGEIYERHEELRKKLEEDFANFQDTARRKAA